jgi:putative colanic acid biosynthesis glycosyltransferase
MKLLQINISLNTSSTGKIVRQISKMWEDDGNKSYMAFSGKFPKNKDLENTIRIGFKLDFYLHALATRIFDKHGFGSIRATKKLIKKIDYIKPDIIHLHNLHGYYINIEILFNYLAQSAIPIVWTMHDCWAFTGHCSHFEYVKCEKWKKVCHRCPQSSSYPSSLFIDNSKKNFLSKKRLFNSVPSMTIVSVSHWLDNQIRYSFLSGFKSKVIQNGIDLEVFKPSKSRALIKNYNLHNKFIILGVASNWTDRKGFFEFIKLRELLDESFAIVLVGVNKKLQKILPSGIISIAKTSDQVELAMIYSCADIYLNLTFEDTYPSTNLESIACGTQVVTYKTGGSTESVIEEGGYVINQGDIKAVKNLLDDIKNGVLLRVSEKKLVSTAHARFNKNNNFIHYLKLYKEILKVS